MFCPGCSAASPDGAKFCKSCGMNLTVVTQAVSGSSASLDPIREREYKRARKKISDGIQGAAAGFALTAVAVGVYLFLPNEKFWYGIALAIALAGIVGFFRGVGHILDAKVGHKLLGPAPQARGTGPLTGPLATQAAAGRTSSKGLTPDASRPAPQREGDKRQVAVRPERPAAANLKPPQGAPSPVPRTGRISGEHAGFDALAGDDDLMAKLRN
ncbi:MAG TPA: zinc ribbon domain-containing protein [Blastocatellia bacterium]